MISNNGPRDAAEYNVDLEALQEELLQFSGVDVNETIAARINDFMSKARKLSKSADADRKAIKQPFLDGGRDVDSRFKSITTAISDCVNSAKAILTPYLREQARIAAEEERRAREEAKRKAREAELLKDDSAFGDFAEERSKVAESDLKLAVAKAENAKRVGSATGAARTASLRSYWDAEVIDVKMAAIYFADHPKMTDLIVNLAEQVMRSDKTKSEKIPGVAFKERKEVA
jgi:hypothetical protein